MTLHWSDHLLFFILGVVIPLRTVLGTQPQLSKLRFDTRMKLQLYWGNNLWLWGLCLVVMGVWWWNDRSWGLLGLDWPILWPEGWSLAVMVVFVVLYLVDTVSEIGTRNNRDTTTEHLQHEL